MKLINPMMKKANTMPRETEVADLILGKITETADPKGKKNQLKEKQC